MKTLDLNEMESLIGGSNCMHVADALSGAAVVIGFGTWWTGWGGGIAVVVSVAAYAMSLACAEK